MTTTQDAVASLVVSEVFGPTLQGEGPHVGQPVGFIRTGGCNLHCTWCDTPYTWDASRYDLRMEMGRRSVDAILAEVEDMSVTRVVISGGEPLLHQHQDGWASLLGGLADMGVLVDVETNGTIRPDDWPVDLYVVSPKLDHAGDPEHLRLNREALASFTVLARRGHAAFKVVCRTAADVAKAWELAAALHLPTRHLWVMPEGTTTQDLTSPASVEIAETAVALGLNFTTRLHTLLWGQERAR